MEMTLFVVSNRAWAQELCVGVRERVLELHGYSLRMVTDITQRQGRPCAEMFTRDHDTCIDCSTLSSREFNDSEVGNKAIQVLPQKKAGR